MQGPTLGKGGIVYGTTGEGAIGGSGNIFKLTRHKTYDVMYEFMSMGDEALPVFRPGLRPRWRALRHHRGRGLRRQSHRIGVELFPRERPENR